jgi:hypothetical protein
MAPHEIDELISNQLPEGLLRGLVQAVFTARGLAWEECQRLARPEAENVRPWIARAHLEGFLRNVAERFPQVSATVERASNWNHTEIHAGRLILTQNSVPTPCAMVDASDFRRELAVNNGQISLLPELQEVDPSKFLVLLLHSQYRCVDPEQQEMNGHLAGSAYLAVPAKDLNGYLHRVNLFDRFPDVVRAQLPADWTDAAVVSFMGQARRIGAA